MTFENGQQPPGPPPQQRPGVPEAISTRRKQINPLGDDNRSIS